MASGEPSLGHWSLMTIADWSMTLRLAFQSIGIIYGDIGTSPLYVYSSTFTDGIKHEDDILGVLSMIFYTITLIPLIKYVFIVLKANDNGDGGTFALYSLICRYAKVGLTPREQVEDHKDVSKSKLKSKLENSKYAKYFLLLVTLLGTSMVIGDGVLTPCISVLSAVGGIKDATPKMTQDMIVWISTAILVGLFMAQRFGTDKVGYFFAPIICVWFALIAGIGVHNFIKYDSSVIKAINPKYIVEYFQRNKREACNSLGGIVLAITGAEALFADVGHFSVRSIQISMCFVTYPTLVMAYTGQASFLRKHNDLVGDTFYKSIPNHLYWPMFVVAVLASIIASQAMISGTFSIIQQSLSLGCFPRVKIIHTSSKHRGQVYIPQANYVLMLACIAITLGFRSAAKIGNAYGIAVVFVMTLTSAFLVLIMIMIWRVNIFFVITYVVIIGSVELVYLSSVLYKFNQGGYLPLAFAGLLMAVMFVWNEVYRRKYNYEFHHKISPANVKDIVNSMTLVRMPGIAMFYSDFAHGVPPIFKHYVKNVPALHSIIIFVSSLSLPISKVPPEERFLFYRVEPSELNAFCCVVRYGYRDSREESEPFEKILVEKMKEFIMKTDVSLTPSHVVDIDQQELNNDGLANEQENPNIVNVEPAEEENKGLHDDLEMLEQEIETDDEAEEESEPHDHEDMREPDQIEIVDKAWSYGVVHLVGESEVVAGPGAPLWKKIFIDYVYNFLEKNLSRSDQAFDIPYKRMVKVGMTYEL